MKSARVQSESDSARRVPLPVMYSQRRQRPKPVGRNTSHVRWRAALMIGVYVLMIAHLTHWWLTGRTLSPLVLSESMRTLELGEINPGFLLFVASMLVTVVCGRFLCGWACHMGGLQELCAWLLRRCGVRPRLFRSRVLGYVPLLVSGYMFVWPSLKRTVISPVLEQTWPDAAAIVGTPPPMPPVSLRLTTESLWAGLPSWGISVMFLLVCGCAMVYFLGARGLCRYGCPYGGFFLPLEQLAPGRVVVDAQKCDQCGICTSVCTSGVRVHDEVRLHGLIADRNCVRSLDCVAACPSGALKLGFAVPPILSRRSHSDEAKPHYDLTLGEETLVGGVFLCALLIFRGLYDLIPFLMAVSMAALSAFFAWKCGRLMRDRDVRLGGVQLKRAGAVVSAGRAYLAVMMLAALFLVHSAAVKLCLWRGEQFDDRVQVPLEAVLQGRGAAVPPRARADALLALEWYIRGLSWHRGGFGLADTDAAVGRLAWMHMVAGDWVAAERELRAALKEEGDPDLATANLARLFLASERSDEAISLLRGVVLQTKSAPQSRDLLCWALITSGDPAGAEREYRDAITRRPEDVAARAGLGRLLLTFGRNAEAMEVLAPAAAAAPRNVAIRANFAVALFHQSGVERALDELSDAARARPDAEPQFRALGADLLRAAGRAGEADSWKPAVRR